MSSIRLKPLIAEFPEESDAILRLEAIMNSGSASEPAPSEFPVQRIHHLVSPRSRRSLLKILSRMVELGLIEKTLRLESESTGGLGDFPSLLDVPTSIFDVYMGREVEVRPENLHLIYKVRK